MRSIVRILSIGRSLWPYYLGITVASVLISGTSLATPAIIARATDVVVAALQGNSDGAVPRLAWLAVGLFATGLVATVVSNVGGYLGDVMAVRLRAILSQRYFAHLLALPRRYFDEELTGTIIGRLQRSITQTTGFANSFANSFFSMLITVAAALVIAATYSPWLALLLFAIYPLFTWLTTITSKRWQRLETAKNREYDEASGRFTEVIGQISVVKSYRQELRELRLFDRHYREANDLTQRQSRWWHGMDIARRGALDLIFLAIYLIVFIQTARGVFSVGDMVLLVQLVALARNPVMSMSYLVDSWQRAVTGSKDYLAALVEETETDELTVTPAGDRSLVRAGASGGAAGGPATSTGPETAAEDEDEYGLATIVGESPTVELTPTSPSAPAIEFDHVSFGYDEDTPVLRDLTFAVARGERVAIVGESGGGKTTMASLLLGLYRPESGRLLLDGHDVTTTDLRAVRDHAGVVFQDAALFSGTIRENISYGRPTASLAEIEAAARRANAEEFITRFADGYDSQIGERGVKLSGGQKQRIAIARAILKDAPLLILDEATSSLDSRSERLVQEGLDELMDGRTSVIIAHRLATIATVDRIVTLVDGRVDEIGTPDELATSGGVYAELLALQASSAKRDRKRLRQFDIAG
ncbi:MAG: ABC transporter ATP-binding protein/permease [Propionibacteriaceae bacterium]|nr:ABC transporter ATP-binding protein/permease [Propionibacteriaceae bacterium]